MVLSLLVLLGMLLFFLLAEQKQKLFALFWMLIFKIGTARPRKLLVVLPVELRWTMRVKPSAPFVRQSRKVACKPLICLSGYYLGSHRSLRS